VGKLDGFDEAAAQGEMRGDGGGEGAAAAVGIHITDTRGAETEEDFLGAGEKIDDGVGGHMAALEQDGDTEALGEGEGGVFEGLGSGRGTLAEEDGGFVEIGGDERGAREEALDDGLHGDGIEEERAGGGHHDGVDDGGKIGASGEEIGDGFDDADIGQHAGLEGANWIVGEHLVDLRADESGRNGMQGGDAARVLGGEGGQRGGAIDAAGGEGEQVGLDAGGGAGVGPGDGEGGDGHGEKRQGLNRSFTAKARRAQRREESSWTELTG
jgi:hypothetical protein